MIKALSLLSGGLDSILATKLMLNQGIKIEAINFSMVFCTRSGDSKAAAEKFIDHYFVDHIERGHKKIEDALDALDENTQKDSTTL